jgi:hypothetical protein
VSGSHTVVVDIANVMGSRPDGWWRDRAGAAERLLREIAVMGPGVIAVVEGRARSVPDVDGVTVVRADGSGDDEIVTQARRHPGATVVTADRGLRARLPAASRVMGPREFLDGLTG